MTSTAYTFIVYASYYEADVLTRVRKAASGGDRDKLRFKPCTPLDFCCTQSII